MITGYKISTKAEAFRKVKPYLNEQQRYVLNAFSKVKRPMSRRELAEVTGLPINVVCARINELIGKQYLVVYETSKDEKTNKRVEKINLNNLLWEIR